VLEEAAVFGCDHRVLEIGRDAAERDELVALGVRAMFQHGPDAALRLNGGYRRIH
jgi:hypothetical protein